MSQSPFLLALSRKPTDKVPIWVMRQAGRYLPEYRKLRQKAGSFIKLCKTPELACEVTLQPIMRFGFDAAIIFSDILVIPDALGLRLDFVEGSGPRLEMPIKDEKDVTALGSLDPADIAYQGEAISLCKEQLGDKVPVIGFAGGPFTLACYMVDGAGGGEFLQTRKMMHSRPVLFSSLLSKLSDAIVECLNAQAQAGADVLMIFDSWAQLVPPGKTQGLLLDPLSSIVSSLRSAGCDKPVISFLRGAMHLVQDAVGTGVDALGVDWLGNLHEISNKVGDKVALQGNMDPAVLLTDPATVKEETMRVLDAHGQASGHVFNLGHGIHKDTPIENVEAMVETVRGYKKGGQ